jgi:hypothetical protein
MQNFTISTLHLTTMDYSYSDYIKKDQTNATAQWLAFPIRIWKVTGSKLDYNMGTPEGGFS